MPLIMNLNSSNKKRKFRGYKKIKLRKQDERQKFRFKDLENNL